MRKAPTHNVVVTFGKPDRLENPNEFVADDFDDEDIESVVQKLAPICDDFRKHSFTWHYDLGKAVREKHDELQEQRTSMYGTRFFNRLALELKRPNVTGRLLANCYRLVKRYSEEEYLRYVQQPEVSPTHLLMLANIEDRDLRDELIQKVIDEELTTQQLQTALKEKFGLRHKGKPGRPLMIPKNVKAGITHLAAQADKYIRLDHDCWFGNRFDLAHEIKYVPADKLTDELKDQLSGALEKCERLAETANQEVAVLREILAEVEQRRAAQAELETCQAEEELEEQKRAEREAEEARPSRGSRQWTSKEDRRIGRELRAL